MIKYDKIWENMIKYGKIWENMIKYEESDLKNLKLRTDVSNWILDKQAVV